MEQQSIERYENRKQERRYRQYRRIQKPIRQRLATTSTTPPESSFPPPQVVNAIAQASPTQNSLQIRPSWKPVPPLCLRGPRTTSRNTAPVSASIPRSSQWMHTSMNPMAGMDLMPAERPKHSIMKVRTLQQSIESTYRGGSGRTMTRVTLTAPELTLPVATAVPLYRCVEERKGREQQLQERRRQRTPDHVIELKERPLFTGQKRRRQACVRNDPHLDPPKHGFYLFRDKRYTRIVKRAALVRCETQYKPLSFVEKVGVKVIPHRLDECNANAYNTDYSTDVKTNYREVDQEFDVTHIWRRAYTKYVLPALVVEAHRRQVLRALPHHQACFTFKRNFGEAAAAASLEAARAISFAPETTTTSDRSETSIIEQELDDKRPNGTVKESRTDDSEPVLDSQDALSSSVAAPNSDEDDMMITTGENSDDEDTANDTTNDATTNNDETFSSVDSSNNDNATSTLSESSSRRRAPKSRRRITIKVTDLEVDDATVFVDGRRRSSRFQPKHGSVWVNGQRKSARFIFIRSSS